MGLATGAAEVGNKVAVVVGTCESDGAIEGPMDELGADDNDGEDDGDAEVLGEVEMEGAIVGVIVVILVLGGKVEFVPGGIVVFVSGGIVVFVLADDKASY